jgi:hypothetical protein
VHAAAAARAGRALLAQGRSDDENRYEKHHDEQTTRPDRQEDREVTADATPAKAPAAEAATAKTATAAKAGAAATAAGKRRRRPRQEDRGRRQD